MEEYEIIELVQKQKKFFHQGNTKDISTRIHMLNLLKSSIQHLEPEIQAALRLDLGKSVFETYFGELGAVYAEINNQVRYLRTRAKTKKVHTPLALFPSRSYIYKEPYGVIGIISPWNYPFQLAIMPLIGAIAAGNTCIIKPSEYSPATNHVLRILLGSVFSEDYVAVVEGEVKETTILMQQPLDFVFFTGSKQVGSIIMEQAAKQLIPVCLELGGKSPCVISPSTDYKVAMNRLGFGKLSNAGQTCVAPDYVLVPIDQKDKFIEEYNKMLKRFFKGKDLCKKETYKDYAKIINEKQFDRLVKYIGESPILIGGTLFEEDNKISPTVLDCGCVSDYLEGKEKPMALKDEIFGPILPLLTYESDDEVIAYIQSDDKPLAFYLFTNNNKQKERYLEEVSFGGGCINDTLVHLANEELPFGGVGTSGMGAYHGKYSFDLFTHEKAVVKNNTKLDIKVRYMPYRNYKYRILRKLYH